MAAFNGGPIEALGDGLKKTAEGTQSTIEEVGGVLKKGVQDTVGKIFGRKDEEDEK